MPPLDARHWKVYSSDGDLNLPHKVFEDDFAESLATTRVSSPLLNSYSKTHLQDKSSNVDSYSDQGKNASAGPSKSDRSKTKHSMPEMMSRLWKPSNHASVGGRRKESIITRMLSSSSHKGESDTNSRLLRIAVRKFDTERVVELASNHHTDVDGANEKGITALHEAAIDGNIVCAKILTCHGAAINKCDLEGFTPLDYAVFGGNFECASFLIEKGAKVDRIKDGQIVYMEHHHPRTRSFQRRATFS